MKKTLLLLSFLFLKQLNAQTWVTLPDSNFVHYLKSIVPTAFNGDSLNISDTLVTTTTYSIDVHLYSPSICNLSGIQYFTSLTYLSCWGNSLTSLPALPNTLTYLNCGSNALGNLPALPNSLISLYCGSCSLSTLPALPNSLQLMDCSVNTLTNLPALPNSMQGLNCSYNSLNTLPILPNSLQGFNCSNNDISCFPTLPDSITSLGLDPNPYNCLPNYIAAMSAYDLAFPLCAAGNSNGCAVAGIEQFHYSLQPKVYPNPTSDQFFIDASTTDKLNVDLHDVNGRHVFSTTVNDKSSINVAALNEGVYSLAIKTADRTINKKLVIVR